MLSDVKEKTNIHRVSQILLTISTSQCTELSQIYFLHGRKAEAKSRKCVFIDKTDKLNRASAKNEKSARFVVEAREHWLSVRESDVQVYNTHMYTITYLCTRYG